MPKVGLISDTHGFIDDHILSYFEDCDAIWHAGDIGSLDVTDRLAALAPVKAVYGNIDNAAIRQSFPEHQIFNFEGIDVLITHIGGYPGRYSGRVQALIHQYQPKVVMVGHSHIVKVMRDPSDKHLHINPGAAGVQGFHKVRTIATMHIDDGKMHDFSLIELGKRGAIR